MPKQILFSLILAAFIFLTSLFGIVLYVSVILAVVAYATQLGRVSKPVRKFDYGIGFLLVLAAMNLLCIGVLGVSFLFLLVLAPIFPSASPGQTLSTGAMAAAGTVGFVFAFPITKRILTYAFAPSSSAS